MCLRYYWLSENSLQTMTNQIIRRLLAGFAAFLLPWSVSASFAIETKSDVADQPSGLLATDIFVTAYAFVALKIFRSCPPFCT